MSIIVWWKILWSHCWRKTGITDSWKIRSTLNVNVAIRRISPIMISWPQVSSILENPLPWSVLLFPNRYMTKLSMYLRLYYQENVRIVAKKLYLFFQFPLRTSYHYCYYNRLIRKCMGEWFCTAVYGPGKYTIFYYHLIFAWEFRYGHNLDIMLENPFKRIKENNHSWKKRFM